MKPISLSSDDEVCQNNEPSIDLISSDDEDYNVEPHTVETVMAKIVAKEKVSSCGHMYNLVYPPQITIFDFLYTILLEFNTVVFINLTQDC